MRQRSESAAFEQLFCVAKHTRAREKINLVGRFSLFAQQKQIYAIDLIKIDEIFRFLFLFSKKK